MNIPQILKIGPLYDPATSLLGTYPKETKTMTQKMFAAAAKSLQACPTLCDPIDSSPPGSSVHRTLQAGVG